MSDPYIDAVERELAEQRSRERSRYGGDNKKANGAGHCDDAKADGAERLARLGWQDMARWDSEPVPEREWAIKDRVPLRQAGLFSGEGGTGKSIIELRTTS